MVRFAMMSDKGSRPNNEDSIGMYEKDGDFCFLLADGLGGHGKGEVASSLAVETCVEEFMAGGAGEERTGGELPDGVFLDRAFLKAQERILKGQQEDRTAADMKTTLVVLDISGDQIRWGHIGDSRLYYFKDKRIQTRTLDHSVPQMLVSIGEIKEKQIRRHPDRNRLLRVLGVDEDELRYQLSEPVRRGSRQAFLMCSDGFWELIEEKKMESTFKKASTPDEWLEAMKGIVLKNGRNTDMDNYSAIAVWID